MDKPQYPIVHQRAYRSSAKFEEASKIYERIPDLMKDGVNASEVKTIHELLLEAASLEEEAGMLMINAGRAMIG